MNIRDDYEESDREELTASVHVCDVVKVMSFDPAAMTVDVQPLSKRMEDDKYQSQPPICKVPVACMCGGGLIVRPAYAPGDMGFVVYADHDLDAVMSGSEATPNTDRNHDLADALFIGGLLPSTASSAGPAGSIALSTQDGSVYVAVNADGVAIKGDVSIDGTVKARAYQNWS